MFTTLSTTAGTAGEGDAVVIVGGGVTSPDPAETAPAGGEETAGVFSGMVVGAGGAEPAMLEVPTVAVSTMAAAFAAGGALFAPALAP